MGVLFCRILSYLCPFWRHSTRCMAIIGSVANLLPFLENIRWTLIPTAWDRGDRCWILWWQIQFVSRLLRIRRCPLPDSWPPSWAQLVTGGQLDAVWSTQMDHTGVIGVGCSVQSASRMRRYQLACYGVYFVLPVATCLRERSSQSRWSTDGRAGTMDS